MLQVVQWDNTLILESANRSTARSVLGRTGAPGAGPRVTPVEDDPLRATPPTNTKQNRAPTVSCLLLSQNPQIKVLLKFKVTFPAEFVFQRHNLEGSRTTDLEESWEPSITQLFDNPASAGTFLLMRAHIFS